MPETVVMTGRVQIPWTTKINPLWWLVGPDGWNAPDVNNGTPYLPDVKSVWLRRAYQAYTCQQLALEAQAISTRAAALSGAQDSQHTKDGWTTAAAVVIFWPAAFFVGGDKQTAAELAQMKGQMVAIEQASIQKKCGIQFQGKPPVT